MSHLRHLKPALVAIGVCTASTTLAQPSVTPAPAANPVSAPAELAAAPASEAKICRTQEVTGSFVKKRKVCRTKREWQRLAEDHRSQAQDYVDHGRGGSNGD